MELDAVHVALVGLERRDRRGGRGSERAVAGRRSEHGVAVGHPACLLGRGAREQPPGLGDVQLRAAELTDLGPFDPAAELPGEQLHPVTDAEHRHPELQQLPVERRRPLGVHRCRAAGEDHALRLPPGHLGRADVVGQQLAEHAALPHPPGDQLRVLAAVVEHDHLLGGRREVLQAVGTVRAGRRALGVRDRRAGVRQRGRISQRHRRRRPWRPCRPPARAGGACPPSAARARPSALHG